MRTKWTPDEKRKLKSMVESGQYTYGEIADALKKTQVSATLVGQKMGLRNRAYLDRITKHKHLREPVMKFFQTHSFKETMERFGLTWSELKSVQTVSYRHPKLNKYRKDKRRHDVWSQKEVQTFARYSGLQPRAWIAKKLKRGTMQSVKELAQRLGTDTRYLNGLPERLARIIDPSSSGIKTKAGAPGRSGECCHRIVPWVVLAQSKKMKSVHPEVSAGIRAMAHFQKWVQKTRSAEKTVKALKRAIGEK
jgi:O6-methylguanine-DNA--protein-cysteine methyltransferase